MDPSLKQSLIFILVVVALIHFFTASSRRKRKIERSGDKVMATFVSARQTGSRVGASYVMELTLDVVQPDGSLSRCTTRSTVDSGWNLRPGDKVTVFADPANHTEVVLDKNTPPVYATQSPG